jgi:hypothetical protein
VPSVVPVPRMVADSLREAAAAKSIMPLTVEDEARVVEVLERVRSSAGALQDTGDAGVASEVIHEQVCSRIALTCVCVFALQALTRASTGSRGRRRS